MAHVKAGPEFKTMCIDVANAHVYGGWSVKLEKGQRFHVTVTNHYAPGIRIVLATIGNGSWKDSSNIEHQVRVAKPKQVATATKVEQGTQLSDDLVSQTDEEMFLFAQYADRGTWEPFSAWQEDPPKDVGKATNTSADLDPDGDGLHMMWDKIPGVDQRATITCHIRT
jgi:hypothetical protein